MVPSAQSQARGHGEGGGVQYQADTRSQNSRTWGCLALLMSYDIFGILNLSEGAGMKVHCRLFLQGAFVFSLLKGEPILGDFFVISRLTFIWINPFEKHHQNTRTLTSDSISEKSTHIPKL